MYHKTTVPAKMEKATFDSSRGIYNPGPYVLLTVASAANLTWIQNGSGSWTPPATGTAAESREATLRTRRASARPSAAATPP